MKIEDKKDKKAIVSALTVVFKLLPYPFNIVVPVVLAIGTAFWGGGELKEAKHEPKPAVEAKVKPVDVDTSKVSIKDAEKPTATTK